MICTPWITSADLAACDCPDASADVVDTSIEAASEIMYALTGRQYPGVCTETLRPCGTTAGEPVGWPYPYYPVRTGGVWVNTGPCGCNMRTCGCDP